MRYDTVLRGGTLVDPAQAIHAPKDVGFAQGRVASVADSLAGAEAVDCACRIVAPGMIDLHVHVFWGVTYIGIEADPSCVARGVTTAVDAGSSGADTFPGFRKYVIEASATRLYALLNIASQGMVTAGMGELHDLRYANVSRAVDMIEKHRDLVLGIKVRLSDAIVAEEAGLRPLYLAREAADTVGLPIMVHPPNAWTSSLDEVLAVMRPGDLLTHCFHGLRCGILDENGDVRKAVRAAIERGVLFDVGHGRGCFNWLVAERALAAGVEPHTISSDLHVFNVEGPVYDLATTVSKFLHLGLTIDEALAKVTAAPAAAIRMSGSIGTLQEGAWGDAVVLEVQEGQFELRDSHDEVRIGRRRLVPRAVVRAGKVYRGPHRAAPAAR